MKLLIILLLIGCMQQPKKLNYEWALPLIQQAPTLIEGQAPESNYCPKSKCDWQNPPQITDWNGEPK